LENNTNFISVFDNQAGDINALTGVVTYSGTIGNDWFVNVTTGITDPVLTGMDLNSVNVSSTSAASTNLKMWFFDEQGFVPDTMLIGGTTTGTVTYNAIIQDSIGNNTTIGSLGAFGAGAFSAPDPPRAQPANGT